MIETTTDADTWEQWCSGAGLDDIYWDFDYLTIWESEEYGHPVGVRYEGDAGTVLYPVLRVPLDEIRHGEGRVDVRTAYDFGGPYLADEAGGEVLDDFQTEFEELLDDWDAVTEFARLHPLRLDELPEDAHFHAENFVADLTDGYGAVEDEYKASFGRNVRKAEREGLEVDIDVEPGDREREAFSDLYLDTMEKVDADPFYFFARETLDRLMDLPEMAAVTTWSEDTIIASALILRSENDLFYFLGSSDRDYLDLRPNNILFDRIIQHGADSGYDCLHLGGGSPGLRRFKKQMATGTVDYHLLKRVHDEDAYVEMCRAEGLDPDADAFPPYRDKLLERVSE
jgi:hypothetical protein